MNMRLYFLWLIFFLPFAGRAQVNSRIKSQSRSNTNYHSSSYNSNDPAGLIIQGIGFFINWSVFFVRDVIVPYQIDILSQKDSVRRVSSIDIHPAAGIGLNTNGFVYLPRARANWGLFSTDFRYFSHVENGPGYKDTYSTFDWQILSFNFVQTPKVQFYIGSGLMFERYSGNSFNEHAAGLEFFLKDNLIRIGTEGRWAVDYLGGRTARMEASAKAGYRFIDAPHFSAWVTGSFIFQRYFEAVNLGIANVGIAFQLN